ncbi:alpha-N-acetylglucosaminidase [Puteibacter caeruleilacunae]|nr:alpha-N-acetylglucosaminidase [Puteibacter caeruleilacunae]
MLLVIVSLMFSGCTEESAEVNSMNQLVERLVPELSGKVIFKTIDTSESDVFELSTSKNKLIIKGNSQLSMAVGLNYYLKYYCNTHISWYAGNAIHLPENLPMIDGVVKKEAKVKNRFFLNYCTFGYTMPWWDWNDWEHFIDWMALNGVNMPLAITGQEAIWYKVWKQFGLNDKQIRGYFTGPAHLPWHRMSNLDHWEGPLPQSWLDNQLLLQKKIVTRERELGMTPVLPAFAGHVPSALSEVHADAKVSKLGFWGGFEDQYRSSFLSPIDPLFPKIQKAFLEEQTKAFGTDHIYGADPFNEVEPPSWEPEYLANVSSTIYNSMIDVDPDATWLQMSWIFYFERKHWTNERIEAMLNAVPQNKMMLLDYYCENTEVWRMTNSFYEQPYIWCYLGNFGGNTMLAGNLDVVNSRMDSALVDGGSNLQGIGSTLEAFDVNPIMYDFVFEKAWGITNTTDQWVKKWADRRIGDENEDMRKAWSLLYKNVYNKPGRLGQGTLTNARPSLHGSGNWTTDPHIDYANEELFKAWALMLRAAEEYKGVVSPALKYDIVNVGRQVLGNHFNALRDEFTNAYEAQSLNEAKRVGEEMIDLLNDLELLLSTESFFLLGHWIEDARTFGKDETEADYYEKNARTIVTTWGGKAQSLNDYANRTWSGLVKGYYKVRWEMFIDDAIKALEVHKAFDENAFFEKVTSFEVEWINGKEKYNSAPSGNSISIASKLVDKYKTEILK